MASPAGQTNQRGLGLSGSIHEEAHLVQKLYSSEMHDEIAWKLKAGCQIVESV